VPITITDQDMRDQVTRSIETEENLFNVPAIVDELQERYGTVHIDEIPSDAYWAIVEKHDIS
jgi:hypothetical protein